MSWYSKSERLAGYGDRIPGTLRTTQPTRAVLDKALKPLSSLSLSQRYWDGEKWRYDTTRRISRDELCASGRLRSEGTLAPRYMDTSSMTQDQLMNHWMRQSINSPYTRPKFLRSQGSGYMFRNSLAPAAPMMPTVLDIRYPELWPEGARVSWTPVGPPFPAFPSGSMPPVGPPFGMSRPAITNGSIHVAPSQPFIVPGCPHHSTQVAITPTQSHLVPGYQHHGVQAPLAPTQSHLLPSYPHHGVQAPLVPTQSHLLPVSQSHALQQAPTAAALVYENEDEDHPSVYIGPDFNGDGIPDGLQGGPAAGLKKIKAPPHRRDRHNWSFLSWS